MFCRNWVDDQFYHRIFPVQLKKPYWIWVTNWHKTLTDYDITNTKSVGVFYEDEGSNAIRLLWTTEMYMGIGGQIDEQVDKKTDTERRADD